MYVADRESDKIRKIDPQGNVTTFAGSTKGYKDGQGTSAKFDRPVGITSDGKGNLYVAEIGGHKIRKIDSSGNVTTIAGSTKGYRDGQGTNAKFGRPVDIAIDRAGNLFVTDRGNHKIRKIDPQGNVTTFAGNTKGYKDGKGTNAQFYEPIRLVIDQNDNLYITDNLNHKIRKIDPQGNVTTIAGSIQGHQDGTSTHAQFNRPNGIAIDTKGQLFVLDANSLTIRKLTP